VPTRERCRWEDFFDERSQGQTDRTVVCAAVGLKQATLDERQCLVRRNLHMDDAKSEAAPAAEVARPLSDRPRLQCSLHDQ
jgi:hypothetical protein